MTGRGESRRHRRQPIDCALSMSWRDNGGNTRFLRARCVDISESGARAESGEAIETNTEVFVRVDDYGLVGCARVRHCGRHGAKYVLGLEMTDGQGPAIAAEEDELVDFYELMQISPSAEAETIHRVYRMLAARYHPDNNETGDPERFLLLTRAFQILGNPQRRSAYDATYQRRQSCPIRLFELKEFVGGVDGEANRRLGILCLLYNRRRMNPENPGLSVLDFEKMTSIPREHLTFAFWFLKGKRQLRQEHNGDYEITAEGVDFVESHLPAQPLMRRLLIAPAVERGWRDAMGESPAAEPGPVPAGTGEGLGKRRDG